MGGFLSKRVMVKTESQEDSSGCTMVEDLEMIVGQVICPSHL